MKERHVVAAVEVVVDEDLPVAMELVLAALEERELGETKGQNVRCEAAEVRVERGGGRIEVAQDEVLPRADAQRDEAVVFAIEALDPLELRRRLERAVERVRPAVVRAAKPLRAARRFGDDGRGVMAAHVEERAKHAAVA